MCGGSDAGSYLRLIDFVYHSTLGLGVIKKKKREEHTLHNLHRGGGVGSVFLWRFQKGPRDLCVNAPCMSLKYESASEPLHVSVKQMFSFHSGLMFRDLKSVVGTSSRFSYAKKRRSTSSSPTWLRILGFRV